MTSLKRSYLRRINQLFLWTVVLPTALAALYFGLFASDVYTSESSFVVRSPDRAPASGLGMLLKGAGFSRAQDDSYTVQDYILSRDALRTLVEAIGIDKGFAHPDVDRFSRFAGIDPDNSFEALHRYYRNKVAVRTDTASSISTLSVKAFSATDALKANQLLLERSEALVNRLNERGRADLIKFAQLEVEHAQERAKAAALAVSTYRNRQGVVDPERQATAQLQQVAKLQDELIATTMQLAQLQEMTPRNPQVSSLQNRIRGLRKAIAAETGKVTGDTKSLSNKAAEFQRLSLDAEFSNRQLASALASLENARNEAQRQQVYLERIAQPNLPDVAQDPRRLRNVLATLVLGLVAWGILTMVVAGIKEHQG